MGYSAGDVVQPAVEDRAAPKIPETEAAALQTALSASKELKRLDSNFMAKDLEIKGDKAQRLPRVDLVAQYALLAKFNNYAQYYNTFKRDNEEIGASVQVPIFTGTGVHALDWPGGVRPAAHSRGDAGRAKPDPARYPSKLPGHPKGRRCA